MQRRTREESRRSTQERLRSAALREFAFSGFGGTSIDRITEKAGFSRGAFYANYKSKEEILFELLREYHDREISAWENLLEGQEDIESIYARMAERFDRYIAEAEWGMFIVEVQLYAKRNAEFADEYQAYLSTLNVNVATMLAKLFEKAGKNPPADLIEIAALLRSLVIGLSIDVEKSALPDHSDSATTKLILSLRSFVALGTPIDAPVTR